MVGPVHFVDERQLVQEGTFTMAISRTRRQVRLSRALGIPLTPKAVRYFEKRPYGPGEHGRARKRSESDYAIRLKEKQRLRAQYNIREAQLVRVFEEARRTEGLTGENLVELLEMRLDALVLRAGFARTSAQARQAVVHRHILVDGKPRGSSQDRRRRLRLRLRKIGGHRQRKIRHS